MPSRVSILVFLCSVLFMCGPVLGAAQVSPAGVSRGGMTLGEAAILGVVEGLTEYLPVSSTGHLLLAERALAIGEDSSSSAEREHGKEALDAYTICIQGGAILAVLGLYFHRIRQMFLGAAGKDAAGRRLLINIGVGFLPAAVSGLLLSKWIKSYLFGAWPVVIAWFFGGVAILAVSWWKRGRTRTAEEGLSIVELSWKLAMVIGFIQCIAMWPGVSRSLVTIVGGILVGLSLSAAVEFSFLLGVVTLSAATGYDLLKHGQVMLQTFDGLSLAVGVIFAFISAVLSIKWMVGYLNRHGLAVFGYYRVILSLLVATLLMTGVL